MRFTAVIANLGLCLGLPAEHTVTSLDVVGDVVHITLDDDAGTEVVATYTVDVDGHRSFSGFEHVDVPPAPVTLDADGRRVDTQGPDVAQAPGVDQILDDTPVVAPATPPDPIPPKAKAGRARKESA